jgi:hypothetical protein
MDLEAIKRCWQEEAQALPPRLEEGPVVRMVTNRAADLRRRVRRRLRREAEYYLPMMALVGASLVSGFTANRVLTAVSVGLLLSTVMATLWRAQRRIEDVPLDRSVREALIDLGSKVEAAGRAYLAVYVALFVVGAVALVWFVWWRHGVSLLLAGAGAGGVLAVVWSHRTGRAYVERMFRRYEVELADCLRQLEEPT